MNSDETYAKLFAGRNDAHGVNKGGVVRLPGPWGRKTAIEAAVQGHLKGEQAIGIFPLRNDGTVNFAAIDLDEPDFELARQFAELVPGRTWIERSRSGNAHVWVFFSEPCPAWAARGILSAATESLGRPDVEVFPKQDELRLDIDGRQPLGNYINLPYFGRTERPMTRPGASDYTFAEFVSAAWEQRTDPQSFIKRARLLGYMPPSERPAPVDFGSQANLHVCAAEILASDEPIEDGHRSVVLFNVAKQLLNWREIDAEEAWDLLLELNERCEPHPIPRRELRRQFESARRGQYVSTGCDDPLFLPYASPTCKIAHA